MVELSEYFLEMEFLRRSYENNQGKESSSTGISNDQLTYALRLMTFLSILALDE